MSRTVEILCPVTEECLIASTVYCLWSLSSMSSLSLWGNRSSRRCSHLLTACGSKKKKVVETRLNTDIGRFFGANRQICRGKGGAEKGGDLVVARAISPVL